MGKITLRIGWCGFAIAWSFFIASKGLGRSPLFERLEIGLWPASVLQSEFPRLTFGVFFAICFSALMNGAFYAGIAWVVWWAAHWRGKTKSQLGEEGRFISLFLVIGLIFSLLVVAVEAAIHWPRKISAQGLLETYLISANLFALIVLACALSGWALWRLRGLFARRGVARS